MFIRFIWISMLFGRVNYSCCQSLNGKCHTAEIRKNTINYGIEKLVVGYCFGLMFRFFIVRREKACRYQTIST